jgi:hypothetical protein
VRSSGKGDWPLGGDEVPAAPHEPSILIEDPLQAAEPTLYRIPCPRGHVLKAREDMLGQQVCCPECSEFFVLRASDSVEFRRQQALRRAEAEEQRARAWLKTAIWAAVLIFISFVAMLIIGLNPGLFRR